MPATPHLVIDLTIAQANIDRTAAWAKKAKLTLRPHVKTHKSPEIARLQRRAGAVGITVASIGEAEIFAEARFDDLFIAYPLWPDNPRRARLINLTSGADVRVGFDSLESATRLVGTGVRALVEVDSGHHRTGVLPAEAGALAAAAKEAGLDVIGVFTFPGHSYGPGRLKAAAADEAKALRVAVDSMAAAGVPASVVSGGSTPSLTATGKGISESRPGVYVFNDAQQWELGSCGPEDIALTCFATVVSHAGGRLVLDSGSKILGADRPMWTSGFGRLLDHPGARLVLLSEHHAVAEFPSGEKLPALGSIVRVVPNHACTAVNLVGSYVVKEGDRTVAAWAVEARGRND